MSLIEQSPDPATILERYADGSIQLEAAIASLNEADLDTALDEKSWTIRQIVHHIVDGDDIWRIFVKMTLGSSEAVFRLHGIWNCHRCDGLRVGHTLRGQLNLTATNGRDHLHEIREPIRAIDPYADLTTAASEFGLEDGFDQLSRFFTHVTCYCCEGVLVVTEVQPLVACILSSDRPALVSENPEKLARLIEHRMKAEGAVHITQDTAMFEAVKEERKQRD